MRYIFSMLIMFILGNNLYSQVNLVSYLPKKYVTNGSVDYTSYIQKGINENLNVVLPDFPILINERGLTLRDNQTITFQKNSKLILKPTSQERYGILNVKYVENVVVNNPTLIGDKERHLGKSGEWGMGINIWASKNVVIINPKISLTWGDGIYIGEPPLDERRKSIRSSFSNSNIKIVGGEISNCLRNGISIVSGEDIFIEGITIRDMKTKSPKAAIDIEPNGAHNHIKNIFLKNITTSNNYNGIIVFLANLVNAKEHNIGNIYIENHKDYNSISALVIRNSPKNYNTDKYKRLQGNILVKDASYYGTKNVYNHHFVTDFNPKITFSNIKYYKVNANRFIEDLNASKTLEKRVNSDPNVTIKK